MLRSNRIEEGISYTGYKNQCMEHWKIADRFESWCCYSEILRKIHPKLCIYSQGLAQIDKMLIFEAEDFSFSITEKKSYNAIAMGKHHTISEFWVFGVYEFLRTLDEICSENPSLLTTSLNEEIKELKYYFEHVRIPLAKLEPARRYINTDYPDIEPGFLVPYGTFWQVSDALRISRRNLSDKIFSLLEKLNET